MTNCDLCLKVLRIVRLLYPEISNQTHLQLWDTQNTIIKQFENHRETNFPFSPSLQVNRRVNNFPWCHSVTSYCDNVPYKSCLRIPWLFSLWFLHPFHQKSPRDPSHAAVFMLATLIASQPLRPDLNHTHTHTEVTGVWEENKHWQSHFSHQRNFSSF